ncbi:ATP-binding cassette domain-containing protein [Kitasatospora sp. NPDC056651]|uniref:ATP-binding cassette domain-containing protein n=1 Tax=Kitasatospora sp. NPDC056651 TaxID=3345892 RepID=UPI0036C51349
MPQPALLAHDLVRHLGGRRVLDGVSLTASPGRRIGLIGENGVGKSTLLRVLADVDEPDAGSVSRPEDLGFLHQEMPFEAEATIAAVLADALREARADLAELDRLGAEIARVPESAPGHPELLAAYAERLEQARHRESRDAGGTVRRRPRLRVGLLTQDTVFDRPDRTVHDTYARALGPARAERVPLGSLGLLHPADLDKPVGRLSVGQRRRLALALLVADPPELLLLDEPTNHLSPRLCDELEEALGSGPGAIVLASHDRWLRRRRQGRELPL